MGRLLQCGALAGLFTLTACAMGGPPLRGTGLEGTTSEPGASAAGMMMPSSGPAADASTPPPPPPPAAASEMMRDGGAAPLVANPDCKIDLTMGVPPLPDSCLPRCAPDTLESMFGCSDGTCRRAVMAADSTPSTSLTITRAAVEDQIAALDCELCFDVQSDSCAQESCPSQMRDYLACRVTGAMCRVEGAILGACVEDNQLAHGACQTERLPRCFGI